MGKSSVYFGAIVSLYTILKGGFICGGQNITIGSVGSGKQTGRNVWITGIHKPKTQWKTCFIQSNNVIDVLIIFIQTYILKYKLNSVNFAQAGFPTNGHSVIRINLFRLGSLQINISSIC